METRDLDAVARIMAENELWQKYGVDFEKARKRFKEGLEKGADIFVVEENGRVAGFLWLCMRGAFDRSGYVKLIGIAPDFQGMGLGRKLMKFAEKKVFEETDAIFLLVSDFNKKAQNFYKSLGYIEVGRIPDYVKKGITELIYFKRREP